jgi:hypothetical protein
MSGSAAQLPQNNCAVWISKFGSPLEVAELRSPSLPVPLEGQALVEMEYSPVNPADLNVLEGRYGQLPVLPCVPGHEGVGRVVALSEGAAPRAVGQWLGRRVLLPSGFGAWQSFGVARVADLVAVPEAVPAQQAAMLRINPATAFCMLQNFATLRPGDWLVQNAANSGVGRSVIQIARAKGLRTVNVVRRPGLEADLRAVGADGGGWRSALAGAQCGGGRERARTSQGAGSIRHFGDLRRHGEATPRAPQWPAYFQGPYSAWILDFAMVPPSRRPRDCRSLFAVVRVGRFGGAAHAGGGCLFLG